MLQNIVIGFAIALAIAFGLSQTGLISDSNFLLGVFLGIGGFATVGVSVVRNATARKR